MIMEKKSMPEWRKKVLKRLDTALILLELVLSAIFIFVGHFTNDGYVRGVGVGLVIAWVTGAIAYLYKIKSES
jgi:Na+-driven multidrug efflux pump